MTQEAPHVLVVDDDGGIQHTMRRFLEKENVAPIVVGTVTQALQTIKDPRRLAGAFVDFQLDGERGEILIEELTDRIPDLPTFGITGSTDILHRSVEAARMGMTDIIPKTGEEFLQRVRNACNRISFLPIDIDADAFHVRYGGSAADFYNDRRDAESRLLIESVFVGELERLAQQSPVYITTGTGPRGDVIKDRTEVYVDGSTRVHRRRASDMYREAQQAAVDLHKIIREHARETEVDLVKTGSLYSLQERSAFPESGIVVLQQPPRAWRSGEAGFETYIADHDTLAWAAHIRSPQIYGRRGASQVAFLKGTDGLYLFDPNRGRIQGEQAWREQQQDNRSYSWMWAEDLQQDLSPDERKVSRVGTDRRPGHLLGDTALSRWLTDPSLASIRRIQLIPLDPEGFHPSGRHVVTSEPLTATNEQAMRTAFTAIKNHRHIPPAILRRDYQDA